MSTAPLAAPVTAEQITEALDAVEAEGVADDREVHVYGPPGTGKTTWLSGSIRNTVGRRGSNAVMVSSFTVAAATELTGRNLPLPKRAVGTLHSHAYRAIEHPEVAAEHVGEFNDRHPGYVLTVPGGRATKDGAEGRDLDTAAEEWTGATDADVLLSQYDRLRNRMTPRDRWPGDVRRFADAWEGWKRDLGVVDFTDMIEVALRDVRRAPNDPQVIFCDEVQDNTALELALVRKWGQYAEKVILAGDDDQMIYGFRGATVDGFVGHEVSERNRYVLGQSYRIPGAVHRAAESWIRRVERRAEKAYAPRLEVADDPSKGLHEGRALASRATFEDASTLMSSVERQLSAGRSVMLLATCSYQLDPMKHELRKQGIPFHNPYRRRRGDWNPLGGGNGGDRVSSAERLAAYLIPDEEQFGAASRLWTGEDVRRWAHLVKSSSTFAHGAKKALADLPNRELTQDEFMALLRADLPEETLDRIVGPDLSWLRENLLASRHAGVQFPLQVAARRGGAALLKEPQVVIGTIHCSPGDELVSTTRGAVRIDSLGPEDRLVGYHRETNRILGRGGHANSTGYGWERSERRHVGALVTLETARSRTRVTPNHRVLARFDEDAFCDRWVVYLMRRGDWWRVGVCTSAHRPYRSGGVAGRLATEQADDGWVLGVYETRREALVAEATVQGRYGVPGLTFQSSAARSLTYDDLAAVHDATSVAVAPRAAALLADWGLSEEWPLYRRRQGAHTNLRGWFCTEAANLVALDGRVCMATDDGGSPSPLPLRACVTSAPYDGLVYGLDVPPHHWYVSGGAVVHNSVKGGQADVVYLVPDLSRRGAEQFSRAGETRDGVVRQFYVGMTRAREELVVLSPATDQSVPVARLLQGARAVA